VNLGLRTPGLVTVLMKTVCHCLQDFCTQACMEKYDQMSNNQPPPVAMHQCAVCNNEKIVKVEVILDNRLHKLCSEPCFAAFKFVNKINAGWCTVRTSYKKHNIMHHFRLPISLRPILILSHLFLGLPSCLLPSGFLTRSLFVFLFSLYIPHDLPILSFLIWSPFTSSFKAQISSSLPYSETPSICLLFLM